MPLIRSYPQATTLNPTDAFVIDRIGTGTMYVDSANLGSGAPYEASFEFFGLPPAASELMGGHFFPVGVSFGTNMTSSYGVSGGFCTVAPASAFSATVYHVTGGVATSIGTMGISTLGAFSFSTSAVTFAAGDSISFNGPASPDAALENLWWTILGTQT